MITAHSFTTLKAEILRFKTTDRDCRCAEFTQSDALNTVCPHMQMVRQQPGLAQYPQPVSPGQPGKARSYAHKPLTLAQCRFSFNYRAKYGTTVRDCRCESHLYHPADACKHMLLERLMAELDRAARSEMMAAARRGEALLARMTVYQAALAYHQAAFAFTPSKFHGLAVNYLTQHLRRWARYAARQGHIIQAAA